MNEEYSPNINFRGILAEVYGIGILIFGDTKVEKSMISLELIHRGHSLVTDKLVNIYCKDEDTLIGTRANNSDLCMEIKHLGIINVNQLFGDQQVLEEKNIQLLVKLEENNSKRTSENYALNEKYMELGGIKIPFLRIVIESEQDIPGVIESAILNFKDKNNEESG